jgi:hypothetical protein
MGASGARGGAIFGRVLSLKSKDSGRGRGCGVRCRGGRHDMAGGGCVAGAAGIVGLRMLVAVHVLVNLSDGIIMSTSQNQSMGTYSIQCSEPPNLPS